LAGLVEDSSGNLFGTTSEGGSSGNGTIFELQNGSGAITTLFNFDGNSRPSGNLVLNSDGNIFGIAGGGTYGYGRLFELAQGTGTLTTVASFDRTNQGANSLL